VGTVDEAFFFGLIPSKFWTKMQFSIRNI